MFDLFKTSDIEHPTLGTLKWSRGYWRGVVALPGHHQVPLVIAGSRKGPDPEALAHAIAAPAHLARVQSELQRALFAHYEPYGEAVRQGLRQPQEGQFRSVSGPEDALRLAQPEAVVVVALDDQLATEVCYRVPWDEEHTLGARFRGQHWIELCGSTLVP